ncbi:MAG: hypothetical protein EOO90_26310 [Pedobacter sp.]|nr:MAG: hypothetical protein EOO90_26310 [Pedobacter sp.]
MSFINIFLFLLLTDSSKLNVIEIRNLYEKASKSSSTNTKLIEMLKDVKEDNPLLLGYKGAAIMMEANHLINPISKLNRFKKGKVLVERAIHLDGNEAELRYVRLAIQTNVPGFLGYSKSIESDKKILIAKLDTMKDKDLRSRVVDYLLMAKICNTEELKKVNLWKNK